jgi:hypothetical protein
MQALMRKAAAQLGNMGADSPAAEALQVSSERHFALV